VQYFYNPLQKGLEYLGSLSKKKLLANKKGVDIKKLAA